ncbi:MAG: helix-turn-helix transcriptional regulator [Verrucomicrobiales bacterium]|nr:helix-turn-helix transcriptional regulator [Verrucomicrobiales bacterium]
MGDSSNSVAMLLKQARSESGLSQVSLAEASGVPQPNISDYESGRRSPTVRTMMAIIDACGMRLRLEPLEGKPK